MTITIRLVEFLGGSLCAFGLLWGMLSRGKRARWFPEHLQNLELAIYVALAGAALLVLHHQLRKRHRARARHALRAHRNTAADSGAEVDHDWRDLQFRDEVMTYVADRAEEEAEEARCTLGSQFAKPQERIALRPCWPPRKTKSWIGGLPQLPQDYPWPAFEDRHGSFLAQIWLEDLPETLWQGSGPRKGWLVFFAHPDYPEYVDVRHILPPVSEMPQPAHTDNLGDWNSNSAVLRGAFGQSAVTPPQWYLEPADGAPLGAAEDIENDAPEHWDQRTGNPVWRSSHIELYHNAIRTLRADASLRAGVDWPSLRALCTLVSDMIEQHLAKFPNTGAPDSRAEELRAAHEEIATFRQAIAPYSAERKFNASAGIALQKLVDALDRTYPEFQCKSAYERRVPQIMESYARRVCAMSGPKALPAKLRGILMPVWQRQAEETHVFLGLNETASSHLQPDARLIDLPSNPLTETDFNEQARLYVDLPASALARGEFYRANGSRTH